MKRKEVKELLPIIQAWAEGKEIQFRTRTGKWVDIEENGGLSFVYSASDYRIKPEPKYRPFKNQKECWDEMLKHQPFGWFRSAYNENLFNIVGINNDGIKITNTLTKSMETYSQAFKSLKFTDGTPVGIKEDIKS